MHPQIQTRPASSRIISKSTSLYDPAECSKQQMVRPCHCFHVNSTTNCGQTSAIEHLPRDNIHSVVRLEAT